MDQNNQETFTIFLNSKINITFSKTHMINKKTTWLLNLQGSIHKIFHSSLYPSIYIFYFHQDIITFWFIISRRS